MELLFRRSQTSGNLARVDFQLWGKVELDEEEQGLVGRYNLDGAMLIEVPQPDLVRKAVYVGIAAALASALILPFVLGSIGIVFCLAIGAGAGWWYVDDRRETIYVRDLMHGRHFKCRSVIELARKEAWLTLIVSYLRQVMESAKHWDGTETHTIEALPKDEARQVILRGL